MLRPTCLLAAMAFGLAALSLSAADAQDAKAPSDKPADPKPAVNKPTDVPDKEKLHAQFAETLSGAKLAGRFTFFGKEDKEPVKEEYIISSVKKLPEGDYWLFNARIKYGGKDVTVPLPLEVKWAGDTPVITLTDFTIPGMGTFSARVVIYRNTYAGWWQHGDAGGHMFGKVEKVKAEEKKE